MSVKTVRKVFIFVLIVLPLQYIVVGIVGYYYTEPWPAFVFPGFKNVYETNGRYEIHQTFFDLYDNQGSMIERIQPHDFFPELPRSQIAGFMRSDFHKTEAIQNLSSEAKDLLHQNSRKITDQDISRIEIMYEVDFVKSETSELEPDSVAQRLIGTIDFTD